MIDAVEAYLRGPISLGKLAVSSQGLSKEELLKERIPAAIALLDKVKYQWQEAHNHIEENSA